jgi:hypothetical protein
MLRDMLDLMPSPGLVRHQLEKHGTCSGLIPEGYFDDTRRARARIAGGTLAIGGASHPVRGTLELFPDQPGVYMRYALVPQATPPGAVPDWEVTGVKRVTGRRMPRLRDLTTLALTGTGPGGEPGRGTIRIGAAALIGLGLSVRATGGGLWAIARFAAWFARSAARRAGSGPVPVTLARSPRTTRGER